MRRFLWLNLGALLLAGITVASSGGATQAEARWVITDLGTLGGAESEAVAINERGQIVGWSETRSKNNTSGPIKHAFLWQSGNTTDLGALGPKWDSVPSAINDHGQIAGFSTSGDWGGSSSKAFTWARGTSTALVSLGGPHSYPEAMNNAGQIVGSSALRQPSGTWLVSHAVRWSNGTVTDLGVGRRDSAALAVDRNGRVVGWSNTKGEWYRTRPVLWSKGKMLDLGTLKEPDGWATDINERGQIIGTIGREDSDEHHAVLWFKGKCIPLGALSGRPRSAAIALNARGLVVGTAYKRYNSDEDDAVGERAFLWREGKLVDLGTLGGKETYFDWFNDEVSVHPINDRGQIVGGSQTAGGREHAFLWESGEMIDLGTLPGGRESHAVAINERGQIVGWSESGGRDRNHHAVLWTLKR